MEQVHPTQGAEPLTKTDVYQSVTDRIVAELEKGVAPWRKPWRDIGGGPRNIRNGRAYRGVNVLLLTLTSMAQGYTDPRWGTFKAVKETGGSVRKGEHGTRVILWKPCEGKPTGETDPETGKPVREGYLLLRDYVVFNADQCDGVPADSAATEPLAEHERNALAESIVAGYVADLGPTYETGGDVAIYSPTIDAVRVPELGQFTSADAYYTTAFHELTHSTGHKSRLDRLERGGFGTEPYAREELVAELGAAMLAGIVGLDPSDQSAAYVGGWLSRLQDDRRLIVQAAAQAQKGADRILRHRAEQAADACLITREEAREMAHA